MFKKALLAVAFSATMLSAHAGVVITEGFDDITTLPGTGWVLTNASKDAGSVGWYQPTNADIFPAQDGAPLSYIASNYLNALTSNINNWLITPLFSTVTGGDVSFWVRGAAGDGFFDQINYGFSNGSAATTAFTLGEVMTVGTDTWTQVTAIFGAAEGNARFAIHYTGSSENANFIGIDSVTVTVPEPASLAILGVGLLGMGAARRRKNRAMAA